jgi:hypothetical protein
MKASPIQIAAVTQLMSVREVNSTANPKLPLDFSNVLAQPTTVSETVSERV